MHSEAETEAGAVRELSFFPLGPVGARVSTTNPKPYCKMVSRYLQKAYIIHI